MTKKEYRHTYCLTNAQTWSVELTAQNWKDARYYGHKYAKEHADVKNTKILWETTKRIN